jgi:hypothetical protein
MKAIWIAAIVILIAIGAIVYFLVIVEGTPPPLCCATTSEGLSTNGVSSVPNTNTSTIGTTNTFAIYTTDANGTVSVSRTSGLWSFKVSLNSTSVSVGGAVELSEKLTYIGDSNITLDFVEPFASASVYNSTGAQVWEFTPSQINGPATLYPGETLRQPICIPISSTLTPTEENATQCFWIFREQPVPGVYSVVAEPLFYSPSDQDLGQSLQITLSLAVAS